MHAPGRAAVDTPPTPRRAKVARLLLGLTIGTLVTTWFLRRQVLVLVERAKPYARRQFRASQPALIVNRWSGDGKAERCGLADAAERAGIRVIMLERSDDIVELASAAIDAGADAIGVAGGDGSLGLVASVAAERNVPFFCVPVGTRNHFALDLGLDRDDPLTALDAVRDGDEVLVDYGIAGDRLFLNNVSLGVYAEAVHREQYRENKERTILEVIDEMRAGEASGTEMRFEGPDGEQASRTAMTIVSNNPYVFAGPPDYGRRLRLDSGQLGIATVAEGEEADGATRSGARQWAADRLRVEADGSILAGLDGEAVEFASPLDLAIKPQALRVLVPSGTKPGYAPFGGTVAAELLGLARLGGVPGLLDDGNE